MAFSKLYKISVRKTETETDRDRAREREHECGPFLRNFHRDEFTNKVGWGRLNAVRHNSGAKAKGDSCMKTKEKRKQVN